MGTGEFALPMFRGLGETEHDVVGLFTQPDRIGRGHHQHVNLMKESALERGIPVFQPERVNKSESLDDLRSLEADLFVVAAYGQILSDELLSIPPHGAINLHASLLPRHRGAAPVHYSILSGDEQTGVTIFQIEPKLDAGPILGVVRTPIGSQETSGELEKRLAELSVPLTTTVIDQLDTGTARRLPQDTSQATLAPRMKKSLGLIDWTKTSAKVDCHVRAMQPWPSPYTFLRISDNRSLRLKVLAVGRYDVSSDADPGTVVVADGARLVAKTGDGAVELIRLQPEGKRIMDAAEFLRGHTVTQGDRFDVV